MYHLNKAQLNIKMKVSDLVIGNPRLLLMLEHLDLNQSWNDKSIEQVCIDASIRPELFISIANLYRSANHYNLSKFHKDDISVIVKLLKNSHKYYKEEKYPEILDYIKQLNKLNKTKETKLLEEFFAFYFEEVIDHLDYEEKIVFPYICNLINKGSSGAGNSEFTVAEYSKHHSDIESKLVDLQSLLLIHLQVKSNKSLKRKLLFSLFELENDLKAHSLIEDHILVPLIVELEEHRK